MKKILFALAALPLMAGAAEPFDAILSEISSNNAELKATRAEQTAEIISRRAENRLEAAEVGFDYKWSPASVAATKMGFEVSQSFDWPGVYGARRKAARRAQSAMASRLAEQQKSLELQAETLLLQIVDANHRYVMLRQIVANLDSLHGKMHIMLEQREATELDHRKVALEEIAMKQQLSEAESSRSEALALIAGLNGGELPAGVADLTEYPSAELLPLQEYLQQPAPEVVATREEAATSLLDARVAKMGLMPGFSVGYVLEREEGVNFQGFSLGIRLPEYSAKPQADAARMKAMALEHQAEQAEQTRRAEITAAYAAAEHTRRLLADYEEAFGTNYPQLLHQSLEGGQITYADYFTELNFYLAAHLDYDARLLQYHTLLATLRRR